MRISFRNRWIAIAVPLFCFILILGCEGSRSNAPPPNPVAPQAPQASPSQPPPSPPQSAPPGPRPQFLDFADIPIPSELDLVNKDSYVFQSGNFKAGVLTLKGRVDINSLINFFQMAMVRENWKPKGGFRYRNSILIFEKPDKTCIIKMHESAFYTYAEIYVAPAGGQI